jgi:selenocysteine-specific elongation factor
VGRRAAAAAGQPHDRFILRALSPVTTIGGGRVLDVAARRWRAREAHAAYLGALGAGDVPAALAILVTERAAAGAAAADLAGAGIGEAEARRVMASHADAGRVDRLVVDGREHWFAAGVLARAREALLQAATANAAERPERPFSAAAELAAAAALAPDVAAALLDGLAAADRMLAAEGGYAPAGHPGLLAPAQEATAQDLRRRLEAEPFAPPTLATLVEETHMPAKELNRLLDTLARRGDLVRVDKDLWFATPAVAEARERLGSRLAADGEITLAGFRDLLACGRRNAQALLELFDREGLTRRHGDVRVPRARR